MIDLGKVKPGSTIRIPFSSFDKDDGSSITMTNFAVADILVYKDGSTTERASTASFTATTDFDAKTGKHLCIITLSDNTTAGFFAAGSEYLVAIDAVTVDGVTTGGWIARFCIGYEGSLLDTTIATLASQTSFTLTTGPAEDDALNDHFCYIHDVASAVQVGRAIISDYTGSTKTVTLAAGTTFTVAATDNISVMGPMPMQPATANSKPIVTSGKVFLGDGAHGGSTTVITAERVVVASTTAGEPALKLTGNTSGAGLLATGGATGAGLKVVGGNTSGAGLHAVGTAGNANGILTAGQGSGDGLHADAGATGRGLHLVGGATSGSGFYTVGGPMSPGLHALGGSSSHGLHAQGGSTSGNGMLVESQAGGYGLRATGVGSAGHGVYVDASGTDANGVHVVTAAGHGINLAPAGTSKHGILSTGGNGGTSDGVSLVAGNGGVGLRTGTFTVTGATNLTGAVQFGSTWGVAGAITFSSTWTANLTGTASGNATAAQGANLDATISSRMATYVQPTGFLAAVFPSDPADQSVIIAATDAIISALAGKASQTSVDDLPTNAEFATALGTSDDAVLASIAALNNLSSAQAQAAAAAALVAYDPPTNAEMEARTLVSADYATAANLSAVAGYLDTEIAAILAIANKLDTTLVLDGAVYQFTANALEFGPSGGGGGTSDWTANERTAIRTILGVPASGTTPETPAAGALATLLGRITTTLFSGITSLADWLRRIARKDAGSAGMIVAESEIDTGGTSTFAGTTDSLEAIRDSGGSGDTIIMGPLVSAPNPVNQVGTQVTIQMFQTEAKSFGLTILDDNEAAVDTSGMTLRLVVRTIGETPEAVFKVEDAAITRSGASNEIVTIPVSETQSDIAATVYAWVLWDIDTNAEIQHGLLEVLPALKDVV